MYGSADVHLLRIPTIAMSSERKRKYDPHSTVARKSLTTSTLTRTPIHNPSSIAAPLSDLTAKAMPDKVDWKLEHQQAFEELQLCLQRQPVLQNPDYSRPFSLHTNVSNRGVGVVLSQLQEDGTDLPVAFYSRNPLPSETRYTTTEMECLAVVNAYLLGHQFDIVTDHGALKYLTTIKHGGPRLQPFNYNYGTTSGRHLTQQCRWPVSAGMDS
jgi:hypothetical protein